MYGFTETTGSITQLMGDDHDPVTGRNCCGRAVSPTRGSKSGSSSNGEDVPTGTVGELWTRSPRNMAGYWNNPVSTAATITPDGWLKTGDAGYLGEDDYIY